MKLLEIYYCQSDNYHIIGGRIAKNFPSDFFVEKIFIDLDEYLLSKIIHIDYYEYITIYDNESLCIRKTKKKSITLLPSQFLSLKIAYKDKRVKEIDINMEKYILEKLIKELKNAKKK